VDEQMLHTYEEITGEHLENQIKNRTGTAGAGNLNPLITEMIRNNN
jgi:hypothetical protein